MSPLDFIAKLAALVPKSRVNLIRLHGVFATNSKCRVDVALAKRGKGSRHTENEDKTPEQRHQAMTRPLRIEYENAYYHVMNRGRGRYKAILVDASSYLLQLSRYVQRNPIEIHRPKVYKLEGYQWSSYPAYVGKATTGLAHSRGDSW